MENKFDPKSKIIKITFIEIFPPINELVKPKEDFNIIFQGNDNFYDVKKFLSSKIPIELSYNKKQLLITLIKNNNIFATGLLYIRQGEQNIIFNFENNTKIMINKTVNINKLSECLKLKIFCDVDDTITMSTINGNTISTNYDKYVPKVNLKKPIRINNYKNKIKNKIIYDKSKRLLNNNQATNNSIKKNLVNNSQELAGNYTAFLTEEVSNIGQNFNNNYNDIKKINKIVSNTARKNESSKNKNLNRINKAKSKNFFSTNKKQNKNSGNNIKMNNSSYNLINQNNKITSFENRQQNNNRNISNNRNYYTNRNNLKSNTSTSFINKKTLNNNNSLKTNLNNYISSKILEHVNNNEKQNYINNINDNKKIKKNNINITMNSISTAATKKNDQEISMNSLQDYDDKNNFNVPSSKNTFRPSTKSMNDGKLSGKLSDNKSNKYSEGNNMDRNLGRHKYNKSLCQQSFTEKIFCEKNENIFNLSEKNEKYCNLCKSENKLVVNYNDNNINEINNNINNNNDENNIKEFQEEENEFKLEDNNNYTKLKEDFNLLYNLEYISKINEDLLKLEVELFIEKMSELFSEYHTQMDEKILENRLNNREYNINLGKYLSYNKLKDKLEFLKKAYNKKKRINMDKQNNKIIKANINELDIFKVIFPELKNNQDKKKELKNILSIILKNKGNQELIEEKFGKYKMFMK